MYNFLFFTGCALFGSMVVYVVIKVLWAFLLLLHAIIEM